MATETFAIAKRLSFGDVSLHATPDMFDATEVLRAVKEPSVENFQRALDFLKSANIDRFHRVKDAARENAPGSGESDLKRLRRQFKSLKSNFVQFDVKEGFMEALIQGRPVEAEDEFLAQVQGEVDGVDGDLRRLKASNKRLREQLAGLIDSVCQCIQDFEQKQAEVTAEVQSMRSLMEAEGGAAGGRAAARTPAAARVAALASLGPGGLDPDTPEREELIAREESLKMQSSSAAASSRALESDASRLRALCGAAQAQIGADMEEIEALEAELRTLEAARTQERAAAEVASLSSSCLTWAARMSDLMGALGGITVLDAGDMDKAPVKLRLVTHSLAPTGSRARHHDLSLWMAREEGGEPAVREGSISPKDIDVGEVIQSAKEVGRTAAHVVREIRRRIAALP